MYTVPYMYMYNKLLLVYQYAFQLDIGKEFVLNGIHVYCTVYVMGSLLLLG